MDFSRIGTSPNKWEGVSEGAWNWRCDLTFMFQLDEKEMQLNEQKRMAHSKTKRLKVHLTQQEIVNNELESQLRHKEMERVRILRL